VRHGTEILLIHATPVRSANELAHEWVKILKALGVAPWQFTIDGAGPGKDVADAMEDREKYRGVYRFMPGMKPLFHSGYAERYTEIHYDLRVLIQGRCLKFPGWCGELVRDMEERWFVENSQEKIRAEQKQHNGHRQRCGHSPDWLDAFVYLFQDFPFDRIRRGEISQREFDTFVAVSRELAHLPLMIDDTPAISLSAVRTRCRRIHRTRGLKMVVDSSENGSATTSGCDVVAASGERRRSKANSPSSARAEEVRAKTAMAMTRRNMVRASPTRLCRGLRRRQGDLSLMAPPHGRMPRPRA
jgi:hypothetical protein